MGSRPDKITCHNVIANWRIIKPFYGGDQQQDEVVFGQFSIAASNSVRTPIYLRLRIGRTRENKTWGSLAFDQEVLNFNIDKNNNVSSTRSRIPV